MADAVPDVRHSDVEIVNIVASGRIDTELELGTVAGDLQESPWIASAEHSRRSGNRLLINFPDGETLGILAPSGVYVFTGANSHEDIATAKHNLLSALTDLGITTGVELSPSEIIDPFEVQNVVCTAEITSDTRLDLNKLAIALGLERTEYEPEQFPGLVFKPNNTNSTILVFASGKAVITGVKTKNLAAKALQELRDELESLLF